MFSAISFVMVWALLWVLMLAVCAYAYLRGDKAERVGGILIVGVCFITAAVEAFVVTAIAPIDLKHFLLIRLISDGVLACGFLVLAVRFAHLWLGAALLAQASIFAMQATYFVLERTHDALYAATNNVAFSVLLSALALGAWGAQRRRKAEVREALRPEAFPA